MKWNEHLKYERNYQGWTQTLLAKKLGTNTYTVSRWERGNAFPSPFYREQLSQIFGKTLDQLGLVPVTDQEARDNPMLPPTPPDADKSDEIILNMSSDLALGVTHGEPLAEGPIPQPRKLFTRTFWLVLAVSGIVSLATAIIMLYVLH